MWKIIRRKFYLTAGEQELLAAVVPPGDDLAAVQAHLQSQSGSPASDGKPPSKPRPTKQCGADRLPNKRKWSRSPYPRGGSLGRAEHDLGDAVPVPDHLQPRPRIHGVDEASRAHRRPAKQQAARTRRGGGLRRGARAGVCGGALRCGRWHAATNAEEGEEAVVSPLGARPRGQAAQARALSV